MEPESCLYVKTAVSWDLHHAFTLRCGWQAGDGRPLSNGKGSPAGAAAMGARLRPASRAVQETRQEPSSRSCPSKNQTGVQQLLELQKKPRRQIGRAHV